MEGSYRSILPRPGRASRLADATAESPPPKRQTIALACQRCRTKKVKCNGARPHCGRCDAKGAACQYNDDPENTTHANLVREFRRLEGEQNQLLEVFNMLKNRPEVEADVIYRRLRVCADVTSLLSLVKDGDLVADLRSFKWAPPPRPPAPSNWVDHMEQRAPPIRLE